MPKPPPSLFDKVNFIWQYIVDPCDAPITVYVNTALPALLKAARAWYMPDLQNILLNILRPGKELTRFRSGGKFVRGKKYTKSIKPGWVSRIFGWSIDDILGKWIGGEFDLPDRQVGAGLSFLWIWFGIVERANFYLFAANVGTDFFYDWFSGIHKLGYCDSQPMSIVVKEGGGYRMAVILGWVALISDQTLKQRGNVFNVTGVTTIGFPGPAVVVASYTATNDRDTPAIIGLRLTCISGPDAGKQEISTSNVAVGESAGVSCSMVVEGPCFVWAEDACNGANVLQTQSTQSAMQVIDYPGPKAP